MSDSTLEPAAEIQELMDALFEGVLLIEGDRVGGANRALSRMLGLARDELIGRPLRDLFADADGRALSAPVEGDALRLRGARGDLVPVSLRTVNERVCLVADRSRERRLEQEVWRLAGPEGATGAGPLASEIAGMIEHDIGTASTVLRGYLRMLLEERAGPLSQEQRGFLLEARRETDRIAELMSNLLELAATEQPSALRIVRKPEHLEPLLRLTIDSCKPLFDARDIGVELELELSSDQLSLDAARIEQVLVNLLSNAAKFSPKGSTVRVAACEIEDDDGPFVCVSVIDEGPGVTSEEVDEIFEPFVRGATAESEGSHGVGLGLAVCERIAAAHGGRVEAVPGPGFGHFRLMLPAQTGS